MSEMVEVIIDSIRVSLISQQRIVILREQDSERYLPIWIGIYEAEAIALALQEVEVSRPLTWDLLKNVFNLINARILRVEVVSLREDTYYGNIVAEVNGHNIDIDSRPSDALALAVRAHVPILVARSVMETASIIPEEDLTEKPAKATKTSKATSQPKSEESSERLSVFEDFLEQLNLGDTENPDDDEDETK